MPPLSPRAARQFTRFGGTHPARDTRSPEFLSLVIDAIARAVSIPGHPLDLDAGFSINGWLAVLLTFLLARVFAEGTLMRDDLEGTV